jgi:hypothetical protein
MTDELENQLRRALRPVDAPQGFAERLMQRLPERQLPVLVPLPVRAAKAPRNFALPSALAASLVAAVILGQQIGDQMSRQREAREVAAGLAAKQELMQALRVTSQKLDLAYEAVNSPENPS